METQILLKLKLLLCSWLRRPVLKLPALVAKHCGHEFPGGARRIAPGCWNRNHAVLSARGIVSEKSCLPPDQQSPFLRSRDPRFDQPALRGHLMNREHSSGNNEVELVRVAHPNAPLERLPEFAKVVCPRRLHLVA